MKSGTYSTIVSKSVSKYRSRNGRATEEEEEEEEKDEEEETTSERTRMNKQRTRTSKQRARPQRKRTQRAGMQMPRDPRMSIQKILRARTLSARESPTKQNGGVDHRSEARKHGAFG